MPHICALLRFSPFEAVHPGSRPRCIPRDPDHAASTPCHLSARLSNSLKVLGAFSHAFITHRQMSLIALPLVIVNLGAEMVYILDQRLKAQCIAEDKSHMVLNDVVKTWFDDKFIAELFKPQQLYSLPATRQIFERLAHSSIMRLNQSRCGLSNLPNCHICVWNDCSMPGRGVCHAAWKSSLI